MACCAFAVFLLLNLLAPFGWLRRFRPSAAERNTAVAWRFGQQPAVMAGAAARPRWVRLAAGAVAVELLAVLALAAYWLAPAPAADGAADWEALVALHTVWCGDPAVSTDFSLGEP